MDSRITFFGPTTGRYKNRWRIAGQIGLIRDKQVGMPRCGEPATIGLPQLVSGTKVGEPAPVARPGQTARLSSDYHSALGGGISDHKNALTIRLPPLNH